MIARWRKWRDRLTTEAVAINGTPVRVTRKRGQIFGIEIWQKIENSDGQSPSWAHISLVQDSLRDPLLAAFLSGQSPTLGSDHG